MGGCGVGRGRKGGQLLRPLEPRVPKAEMEVKKQVCGGKASGPPGQKTLDTHHPPKLNVCPFAAK